MDAAIRDLAYAVRVLWKDRGFTATAVATLTVCFAANAAVFTVVNSVVLKPLPVPEADRLVLISNEYPRIRPESSNTTHIADYYDRLRDTTVFEEQALFGTPPRVPAQTIEINGVPERVHVMGATPSLFRLLRVSPILGRVFSEEEGVLGRHQSVIVSYGLWQRLFSGDPSAVGRSLRMNGTPYTVIGVMAADFVFVDPNVQAWISMAPAFTDERKVARHSGVTFFNVARLKPDASIRLAEAQLRAIDTSNLERFPQLTELLTNAGFYTAVTPLKDVLVREVSAALYLLWGGAIAVMLIAALNIGNLVLARGRLRMRELAMRLALGARRSQLLRQLVVENLVVALVAGLLGLLLGAWLVAAMTYAGLERLPRAGEIAFDGTVVLFVIGIAVTVGTLIGVMPFTYALRSDAVQVLRDDARTGTSGRGARIVRRGFVIAQMAVTCILLIGAGLLLSSFRNVLSVDPGFVARGVSTATTDLTGPRHRGNPALRSFVTRALDGIRSIPGVAAAGVTSTLPFGGRTFSNTVVAEGRLVQPAESLTSTYGITITPGYFEAMGIRRVRGRFFDDRDSASAPPVTIIDERLAKRLWAEGDPIGKRLYVPATAADAATLSDPSHWLTVVGVAGDVRIEDLAGDAGQSGTVYVPHAQEPRRSPPSLPPWATFVIKSTIDLDALLPAVRTEIGRVDPQLALYDVRTMDEQTDLSLAVRRAALRLALATAGVALLLAVIGIYGVLGYVVAERVREFGIRIALGATLDRIYRLVVGEAAALVGVGIALGLAGATLMRNALQGHLYGVGALDPVVIVTGVGILATVAIIACTLPARRAASVDPIEVLKAL